MGDFRRNNSSFGGGFNSNNNRQGGGGFNNNNNFNSNRNNNTEQGGNNNGINRALFGDKSSEESTGFGGNNQNRYGNQRNNDFRGNNQQDQGGNRQFDKPRAPQKSVIQLLKDVELSEQFTDSAISQVASGQAQNQQYGQVQSSHQERIQMAFCNETTIQICSAEISNQGTQLINGDCMSVNDPNYRVQKAFIIPSPMNDGQDFTVFSSKNMYDIYGFSLLKTDPKQKNKVTLLQSMNVAHEAPIQSVLFINEVINNRPFQRLVTLSSPGFKEDGEKVFVKFWSFENNGIILDESSSINFTNNLRQWFTTKGVNLVAINTLQFAQAQNQLIAIITLKKDQRNFASQNSNLSSTPPTYIYVTEFVIDQQRSIDGTTVKVNDQQCTVKSIKFVQNPQQPNVHYMFYSLHCQSSFNKPGDDGGNDARAPQGLLGVVKNMSQAQQIYSNNYPINDFCISFGQSTTTILAATNQQVQPLTWNLTNDTFEVNKFDGNTLKTKGDIQNVYLYKSNINLVEMNQLISVHYSTKQQNTNKCIQLSTLNIMEKQERTEGGFQDNRNDRNSNFQSNNNTGFRPRNNYNQGGQSSNYQGNNNNQERNNNTGGGNSSYRPYNNRYQNNNK